MGLANFVFDEQMLFFTKYYLVKKLKFNAIVKIELKIALNMRCRG